MAQLRFDIEDPNACVLIDLGTRMVWHPAPGPDGGWNLLGELPPGTASAWQTVVEAGRDTSWT